MKRLFVLLLPLASLSADTPPPPSPIETRIDEIRMVRLHFDFDPKRRYIVEHSPDLKTWAPHWNAPFKERGGGIEIRQLNEYSPPAEYYRLSVFPWTFRSVDTGGDWFGDFSMDLLPDGRVAFVFQNRTKNELRYGEILADGSLSPMEKISGTGLEDTPGWWDNSGYHDVTFQAAPGGIPYIVCMDTASGELICLWKPSGASVWSRHIICSDISSPHWAFPKFAFSPQGTMGVVYSNADGSYLASASAASPTNWEHRKISTQKASNARESGLVFRPDGIALAQSGGSYRVNLATGTIADIDNPGQIQPRRGADGSLLALTNGPNWASANRSTDGGATWSSASFSGSFRRGEQASSVHYDSNGVLSVFYSPSIHRLAPGESVWKRTNLNGTGIHLVDGTGRIYLLLREDDGELSLVTED